MSDAEARLIAAAYGLPTWPRQVNNLTHLVVLAAAGYFAYSSGLSVGGRLLGAYVLGMAVLGLIVSLLANISLKASVYIGFILTISLAGCLISYFAGWL